MKKYIIITLAFLFLLGVYIAFMQGFSNEGLEGLSMSGIVYVGMKAKIAIIFSNIFVLFMFLTNNNPIFAIIIMAFTVELILLYPNVIIQLKQRKIHLFHKKLLDKFNSGELKASDTNKDLYKLYAVNEKIHHKGALMVLSQIIIFFFTFWGLNLITHSKVLLSQPIIYLSHSATVSLALLASFMWFFHSVLKIYYKNKEDYINPSQVIFALITTIITSMLVYVFANIFSIGILLYFMSLILFSSLKYILIFENIKSWYSYTKRDLIKDMNKINEDIDRFKFFSNLWNKIPVVRAINFNLLEEGLSMMLGLLLVLSFFGAFQNNTSIKQYVNKIEPHQIVLEMAEIPNINADLFNNNL